MNPASGGIFFAFGKKGVAIKTHERTRINSRETAWRQIFSHGSHGFTRIDILPLAAGA